MWQFVALYIFCIWLVRFILKMLLKRFTKKCELSSVGFRLKFSRYRGSAANSAFSILVICKRKEIWKIPLLLILHYADCWKRWKKKKKKRKENAPIQLLCAKELTRARLLPVVWSSEENIWIFLFDKSSTSVSQLQSWRQPRSWGGKLLEKLNDDPQPQASCANSGAPGPSGTRAEMPYNLLCDKYCDLAKCSLKKSSTSARC